MYLLNRVCHLRLMQLTLLLQIVYQMPMHLEYGNILLLDTKENFGDIKQALVTDRQYAVEVSVASIVDDVLRLADTFGCNVRNYGILVKRCNLLVMSIP